MEAVGRVAVLIDADNISWKLGQAILGETAKHGTLSIKRAYADWNSPLMGGWRTVLAQLAIQPIQQFAYVAHKNATDSALIIDAMDLLYSNNVDAFCLVSSDSDLTRLAMRLRESGRRVYGIGAKKTPTSFVNACDRFTYLEVLSLPPAAVQSELPQPEAASANADAQATATVLPLIAGPVDEESAAHDGGEGLPDLNAVVLGAIDACARDDGWAMLATVGWYIVNNHPSFDSRNYGYAKLSQLMRNLEVVEVAEVPDSTGFPHFRVRRRISQQVDD